MAYITSSSAVNSGFSSVPNVTIGAAVSSGNTIWGWVFWSGTTTTLTALTDSLGNTYTLRNNPFRGSSYSAAMFTAPVTSGGTPILTATLSSNEAWTLIVGAHSGLNNGSLVRSSGIRQSSFEGTAGSDPVKGTALTSVSGDVILAFAQDDGGWGMTPVPGTGYSNRLSGTGSGALKFCVEEGTASGSSTTPTFDQDVDGNIVVGGMSLQLAGGGGSIAAAVVTNRKLQGMQ